MNWTNFEKTLVLYRVELTNCTGHEVIYPVVQFYTNTTAHREILMHRELQPLQLPRKSLGVWEYPQHILQLHHPVPALQIPVFQVLR
ncbi:hypothetical protein Pelo_12101 [Pelomyxa schiedti]|nr:hypothetical protein Pelo_12101 [Pelomyxa schiedti]